MGICLVNTPEYFCCCDNCRKIIVVPKTISIYNGAQAARSVGWAFGKNGKVLCDCCRKGNVNDRYKK